MRITNKIMQNNNLNNINYNKIMQDKLSTQMSTGKKISRPSEDPVIAIRALRLRSNVTEVTQYYSKNIPDATSWLDVTEGALKNTAAIITNMIAQCTKGSNGALTTEDREIILEQLKALRDEVYATGDADYAGRYVFTGYRTDTSLSFPEQTDLDYTITQQLNRDAIDEFTYVKTTAEIKVQKVDTDGNPVFEADGTTPVMETKIVDLNDINSTNYNNIAVKETDVEEIKVHRIRLAYDNCTATAGAIPKIEMITGANADGTPKVEDLVDPAKVQQVHSYDVPTAYELAGDPTNADNVYYIPETGELVLGENVYSKMMARKDEASTATVNEGEIRITYEKDQWLKGDLRPEHYYACSSTQMVDGQPKTIDYNKAYLNGSNAEKQSIEYDVGFNQTIRVNTTADECFDPNIGREVDDITNVIEDVLAMEKTVGDLEKQIKATVNETDKTTLQSRLKAANKALELLKDKEQKLFEGGISAMQGYLDDTNLSMTACGTRSSKLELIENRLKSQKTTFETLKSENEDIDITEVAILLKSAGLTYEAALMASGKVMQTSLLNFI